MERHTYTCAIAALAALIAAAVLTVYVPDSSASADSGQCGDDVFYRYDTSSQTLEICTDGTGTGRMGDCDTAEGAPPWEAYRGSVKRMLIGSGVTSIGGSAFED